MATAKEMKELGFVKERVGNDVMWIWRNGDDEVMLDSQTVRIEPIAQVVTEFMLQAMNDERERTMARFRELKETVDEAMEVKAREEKKGRGQTLYELRFKILDSDTESVISFMANTVTTPEEYDALIVKVTDDLRIYPLSLTPLWSEGQG